jgi:hypothetical protein
MMNETMAALVAGLPEGDTIPLPEVSRRVGWDPATQVRAIKDGLVETTGLPPAGKRGWQVTRQEALTILAAAALAFAMGLAVVSVLRGIKVSGLDVGQLIPDQL